MSADTPAIDVEHLTFAHKSDSAPVLIDLNLQLPRGSRTLLIGANGGQLPDF